MASRYVATNENAAHAAETKNKTAMIGFGWYDLTIDQSPTTNMTSAMTSPSEKFKRTFWCGSQINYQKVESGCEERILLSYVESESETDDENEKHFFNLPSVPSIRILSCSRLVLVPSIVSP
jgi:hypothetical protein